MTASDSAWYIELLDAVRRRLPIWQAVVAVAAAAVLLRMMPVVWWWNLAYAELRLDLWWPVVLLAVCGTFYHAGVRRHRRTGEPQFFPLTAAFTGLVCVALLMAMLALSASHWGLLWCLLVVVCLGAAGLQLALALTAYAELWRFLYHDDVVDTIRDSLNSGKVVDILQGEAERGHWGSPHGLCVVHREFQSDKRSALAIAAEKGVPTALLDRTVISGDAYLAYLDFQWADTVLPSAARDWERLDKSRELLTICLTAMPEQWDQHRTRMTRWMNNLRAAPDPYFQFLLGCFVLGFCRAPDSQRAIEALPTARKLYAAAAGGPKAPPGVESDFPAVMQDTWLALAHHGIPAQAAFDLWMALRREVDLSPRLAPQSGPDWDAARGAARKFLVAHYAEWVRRCAPGWGSGLLAHREWNILE